MDVLLELRIIFLKKRSFTPKILFLLLKRSYTNTNILVFFHLVQEEGNIHWEYVVRIAGGMSWVLFSSGLQYWNS